MKLFTAVRNLVCGCFAVGLGFYAMHLHDGGKTLEAIYYFAFALWVAVPMSQRTED